MVATPSSLPLCPSPRTLLNLHTAGVHLTPCAECGLTDRADRVSQAWFACRICGFVDHADRNNSRNIRARARELRRRGAPSTAPAPPRKHPDGAGRKPHITAGDARRASPSLQRRVGGLRARGRRSPSVSPLPALVRIALATTSKR
ncbi:zinc ribbon domain-containing protein [Streptomyces sp. NPDC007896]|uniref:zinc ribbon domain-containing protein n=1 Tax=Streptomyces sp. NPDC007896 TaxID=3364784 RepID=UPI0036E05B28